MGKHVDVGAILANLSAEFVDDCLDNLDECDNAVAKLRAKSGNTQSHYDNLHRHVHSIKGTAGTFGFPAVGVIAHRLEDFVEALENIHNHLDEVQNFLDSMRGIAESRQNPTDEKFQHLLRSLPRAQNRIAAVRPARGVNILLVMARNVQRKIIGQELSACGFDMSFVATGVQAISFVLSAKPDVVISNYVLDDMTGGDLARALVAIEATQGTRFALLSSADASEEKERDIPESVAVIKKEVNYTESLSEHLIKWGLFGGYIQTLK